MVKLPQSPDEKEPNKSQMPEQVTMGTNDAADLVTFVDELMPLSRQSCEFGVPRSGALDS